MKPTRIYFTSLYRFGGAQVLKHEALNGPGMKIDTPVNPTFQLHKCQLRSLILHDIIEQPPGGAMVNTSSHSSMCTQP